TPCVSRFFLLPTAPTETSTLSLHDALPICALVSGATWHGRRQRTVQVDRGFFPRLLLQYRPRRAQEAVAVGQLPGLGPEQREVRSEEHTSELQSRENLVCRLLPEKKKKLAF